MDVNAGRGFIKKAGKHPITCENKQNTEAGDDKAKHKQTLRKQGKNQETKPESKPVEKSMHNVK